MPETLTYIPPEALPRDTNVESEHQPTIEQSEVRDLASLIIDWKKMPYRLSKEDYDEKGRLQDALHGLRLKNDRSPEEEQQLEALTQEFERVSREKWNNKYRNNWSGSIIASCDNLLDMDARITDAEQCRQMLDAARIASGMRDVQDFADRYIEDLDTVAEHILFDLTDRGVIPREWLPPAMKEMKERYKEAFQKLPEHCAALAKELAILQDAEQKKWVAEELKKIEEENKAIAA